MIERKNTVLGIEYKLNAPTTIDEAVAICGGDANLLLEHFVQKLVYNHHNADVRAAFVEKVEEMSGIKRKVEVKDTGKKNEDGSPKTVEVYGETETEYFNRVLAETGAEVEEYSAVMQEIANANALDGRKRVRASSAGPRLAKMYLNAAQTILDKGTQDKAAGILSSELGMVVEPTLESLAKALKEREDRKRQEFANALGLV